MVRKLATFVSFGHIKLNVQHNCGRKEKIGESYQGQMVSRVKLMVESYMVVGLVLGCRWEYEVCLFLEG
jgi:hypothetical protein